LGYGLGLTGQSDGIRRLLGYAHSLLGQTHLALFERFDLDLKSLNLLAELGVVVGLELIHGLDGLLHLAPELNPRVSRSADKRKESHEQAKNHLAG